MLKSIQQNDCTLVECEYLMSVCVRLCDEQSEHSFLLFVRQQSRFSSFFIFFSFSSIGFSLLVLASIWFAYVCKHSGVFLPGIITATNASSSASEKNCAGIREKKLYESLSWSRCFLTLQWQIIIEDKIQSSADEDILGEKATSKPEHLNIV